MDSAAQIINLINQTLQSRMNQLDTNILKKYQSQFNKIDDKRYKQFQECLSKTNQIPKCYEQSQKFQFKIDFNKFSKDLHFCVDSTIKQLQDKNNENKVKKQTKNNKNQNNNQTDQKFIINKIQTCVKKYQSELVNGLDRQIKRMNYFL